MRSFQSYVCGRSTADVKFLRPPYGHHTVAMRRPKNAQLSVTFLRPPYGRCEISTAAARPRTAADLFLSPKIRILPYGGRSK